MKTVNKMSFSFNFQLPDDSETSLNKPGTSKNSPLTKKKRKDDETSQTPILKPAEKVSIQEDQLHDVPSDRENVQALQLEDGSFLFYMCSKDDVVDEIVSESKESGEDKSSLSSDLIPNVYEGGLKTWECSVDLVHYLSLEDIAWRGINVCEIGCGSGLPGLYAYIQGATVTFTDYNKEVLEKVTIPNTILNIEDPENSDLSSVSSRCQFLAGDWSYVQEQLDQRFDVILTSETIYNPANYKKLYNIMEKLLKDSGKIFIAAKTYYFGVGGGTRDFEDMVKNLGEFSIKIVKLFEEGVQREILLMERVTR
ncbi:histidine protein methyltransferase 1 homolog isoform X2 [Lineus longissimus]|uniref:histidine protein methyltransferase 1 homolog isoform X2 n=1 Tax=Lineus longissimus TaxID=88925 RepID=UPI00315C5C50